MNFKAKSMRGRERSQRKREIYWMEMENVEEAELERREVKDPEKNGNK